jgi:hypothetical protein
MESVLIIDSDMHRREFLVAACRSRGIETRGVGRVAEIPRWPVGDVVVTDFAHLSDWWRRVGASRVVALVANAAEAQAALVTGATEWIEGHVSAETFAEIVAERILVEQLWMEASAQARFDQFLKNEALAAEPFASEAELELQGSMTAAGSPSQEEPVAVAVGGAVFNHIAVQLGRRAAVAVGVIGAVLATFGTGSYVYQRTRTAPPPIQVVVAALPARDLVRNGGVDGLRPAQLPALAPQLRPGLTPERRVGDNSVLARESLSRAVPQRGPELREPMRQTAEAASQSPNASFHDARSLSGEWTLMTHVESSSVAAFEGLQLGFDVQLQQDGSRLTGNGRKVIENGGPIWRPRQTSINVEGYQEGDRLALTFTEAGTRRRSSGTFTLLRASDDHLRGRFSTDAARSSGFVEARRR